MLKHLLPDAKHWIQARHNPERVTDALDVLGRAIW